MTMVAVVVVFKELRDLKQQQHDAVLLTFFTDKLVGVTDSRVSKTHPALTPPAADRVVTCPWATQRPAPNSSG